MQILLTKPKLHNIILFGHLKNEYQETYRSGHNELDSKSSSPSGLVGSNPTVSALKTLEKSRVFIQLIIRLKKNFFRTGIKIRQSRYIA